VKNYKFLLLVILCFVIAYFIVGKNRTETINNSPQVINQTSPTKNPQPTITQQQPTSTVQSQQVSKPVAQNTCREGNVVRQNVKPCGPDLECYSLVTYNERFCRLPDGTCKFFCSDK
jgi:uncharacterized protein (UPF0333 family)